MRLEDESWISSFIRDGFYHFLNLVDEERVTRARNAIDIDLATKFNPEKMVEYSNQTFCPDLRSSSVIGSLFDCDAVQKQLSRVLDMSSVWTGDAQIAIRKGKNAARIEAPTPHIDGIPTADNGMTGNRLVPFTALAGVFLSDVTHEFAGNFTVWPGSHYILQQHFRENGPHELLGMPTLPLSEPRQLLCRPGDLVLCHYLLAHGASVNVHSKDRYAVFFRLWHQNLNSSTGDESQEISWKYLSNMWSNWKVSDDS